MRSWTQEDLQPFELLSSPLWVFDILGERLWWANPAAIRLWGANSLRALQARDFSSDMSDSTRVRLRDYLARFAAGEAIQEAWAFYPKGGAAVSVNCVFSGMFVDDDKPVMLVEASPPKTNIQAYELRAVEALRHTRVVISLFDAEGMPLFENPSSLSTVGPVETRPSLWDRFADPEEAKRVKQMLDRGERYSGEMALLSGHGPRWYGMDASPTRDPVQATPAILVNARDITEERNAKDALIEATRAADQANRAKSAFLANMSHEIRTPMNGVLGMSSLLFETELSEEQKAYVEAIHVSATALLGIINDILDLSRIDARKLPLETIDFDLRKVLDEALLVQSTAAAEKQLELISFIEQSIPTVVRGDPRRLRQVLTNLLGNAVKFTDSGEVSVTVSIVESLRDSLKLHFEVRDTGMGIPVESRPGVFDPFVQADDSTTRKFGGTGLGLAIARQLVMMMGGDIGLEATDAQGSTFWFTARVGCSDRAKSLSKDPKLAGFKALVATVHPSVGAALVELLAELGVEARTISMPDRVHAELEMWGASDGVRLIFVDRELWSDQWRSLVERPVANRRPHEIRFVVTSRIGTQDYGQWLDRAGVDGVLSKPVQRVKLTEILYRILTGVRDDSRPADGSMAPVGLRKAPKAPQTHAPVLVAEDNLINQRVVCKMLERFGVQADMVGNGKEAVAAVERHQYKLVLMDCQMPILDGYEATRRIRELAEPQRRTPIVAMTASAMAGDRERCLGAGMDAYVAKPIDLKQVEMILQRFLPEG